MLWKLKTERNATWLIARPTKDTQTFTFSAPEGFAIVRGNATSRNPYMNVKATVALNQLTATFKQMPDPETVYCEFTLADMHGMEYTITGITAKQLMNDPLLSFLQRNEHTLPEPVLANRK